MQCDLRGWCWIACMQPEASFVCHIRCTVHVDQHQTVMPSIVMPSCHRLHSCSNRTHASMLCCADTTTFCFCGQHMCDQVRCTCLAHKHTVVPLERISGCTLPYPQLLLKHDFTDYVHVPARVMWCWGALQTCQPLNATTNSDSA